MLTHTHKPRIYHLGLMRKHKQNVFGYGRETRVHVQKKLQTHTLPNTHTHTGTLSLNPSACVSVSKYPAHCEFVCSLCEVAEKLFATNRWENCVRAHGTPQSDWRRQLRASSAVAPRGAAQISSARGTRGRRANRLPTRTSWRRGWAGNVGWTFKMCTLCM